jgi:hypothetical protein
MIDFFTFKTFIAIKFFIFLYYFGAVAIPLLFITKKAYIAQKIPILDKLFNSFLRLFKKLSFKQKIASVGAMVLFFLFLEIMWRICFEIVIGYFQLIQNSKIVGGV